MPGRHPFQLCHAGFTSRMAGWLGAGQSDAVKPSFCLYSGHRSYWDAWTGPDGYRSPEADNAENAFYKQRDCSMRIRSSVSDPTALLVIDEADRLKVSGLEQVRDIFDHGGIGLVLIGMPGIEKRLARYPQFYSRIGFVHEFRPLDVAAIQQLLDRGWTPPGVHLPQFPLDAETVAAIIGSPVATSAC